MFILSNMADGFTRPATPSQRIKDALNLIYRYGSIDGGHHKQWVLDQLVRTLVKSPAEYQQWVSKARGDYDEREQSYEYDWDEGCPP